MPLMYKNPPSHASPLLSNPPLPLPPNPLFTGHDSNQIPPSTSSPSAMFSPFRRITLAASSWLHTRRSRCLFLLLCSPLLLPFLCASFPLLCAAELCIRICRRSRRSKEGEEEDRFRRCEEGFCNCDPAAAEEEDDEEKEVGLLQRYLEDQLSLVGSMYECGDEFDSEYEQNTPNLDFRTPLLA
ncbi:uncharacterized protein [Euphorbia lathyris]|uniref:uncharacterized protein n=1 Tax=Euphorbia lathyris TaxID=212925 RepID=UPI00331358F4